MMTQEVTRREASASLIEKPRNLDLRLSRLMAFIAYYQDLHHGETPTVDAMANEMGTTHQTIRYWLGLLEKDNRIRRISQNPLRLMLKERVGSLEMARKFDEASNAGNGGWAKQIHELPEKKQERFEAVQDKWMYLARCIGQHWEETGSAPSLSIMADWLGGAPANKVVAMLRTLEDRGFLEKGQNKLTDNGKIVVGLKHKEVTKMDTQPKIDGSINGYNRQRESSAKVRRDKMRKFMEDYQRQHGYLPPFSEIAEAVGYNSESTIRSDLHLLASEGRFQLGPDGGQIGGYLLGTDLPPAPYARGQGKASFRKPYAPQRGTVKKELRHPLRSEARRFESIAVVLLKHNERYGVWPRLYEVAKALGYTSNTGARTDLDKMVSLDFVRKERPYFMLTDKGRLLLDNVEPKEVNKPEEVKMDETPINMPATSDAVNRVEQALTVAAERRGTDELAVAKLMAENKELKRKLAEALTAPAPSVMDEADMILALVDLGYDVRRR